MRVFTQLSVAFVFSLIGILYSCSDKNKNADTYLAEAQTALQQGNYALAKLKIDSIQLLFPKAYDQRKSGIALMREVRMAENKRNITYCDSMLAVHYAQLSDLQQKFDYIRDDRYQEFGEYYPKVYPYRGSLQKSGVRSGVGEKGALFIESILSGQTVRHTKIKVSSKDNNYVETLPVTADGLNYRFSTLNNTYEIVRYSNNYENGVAKFIYTFQDQPLTVTFEGGRKPISFTMNSASKKGIALSFELSSLLLDIEQLKFEKEKSETLIRYLESRNH